MLLFYNIYLKNSLESNKKSTHHITPKKTKKKIFFTISRVNI